MSDLSEGELERSAFDFGERKIEPVSPIDTNSPDNLLIDLTQPTLSSSSFSDHGFNANGNSQVQTSPLDVQSVDNQSHTNQFDIQSIIREVKGQDLTNIACRSPQIATHCNLFL